MLSYLYESWMSNWFHLVFMSRTLLLFALSLIIRPLWLQKHHCLIKLLEMAILSGEVKISLTHVIHTIIIPDIVLFDDYSTGLHKNLKWNCKSHFFNDTQSLQVGWSYLQADLLLRWKKSLRNLKEKTSGMASETRFFSPAQSVNGTIPPAESQLT